MEFQRTPIKGPSLLSRPGMPCWPETPQGRERCVFQNSRSNSRVRSGKGHMPIFSTLPMNVESHPSGIDVGDLQMGAFPQTQSAAVDGFQTSAVDGRMHLIEN